MESKKISHSSLQKTVQEFPVPKTKMKNRTANQRNPSKQKTNRKCMTGWGHIVNLVWDEKAKSWLGPWALADWVH